MYIHKTLRRINVILLLDLGPHAHGLTWDQQLNLFGAERPKIKGRGSEVTEAVFCLRTKTSFHGTIRTGFFYFIVCLTAYSSRIFAPLIASAVRY